MKRFVLCNLECQSIWHDSSSHTFFNSYKEKFMKKILLGTSALIGAAALFAGAANAAETPKVTLGGISNFEAGYSAEDKRTTLNTLSGATNAASHPGAFRNDNVITVKVAGKSDAGLGYGGQIDLEADATANANNAGVNAERTFIYVDGKWGKLQGGSDLGVTKTMKVDAASIARATGGVDGDFTYFLSTAATGGTTNVIATPDLFLDYGAGVLGDESTQGLSKLSYYTPRISGFQAGVSYLFDTTSAGQNVRRANTNTGAGTAAKNVVLGALNYEGKFSNVGVNLGATGELGTAQSADVNNLRTYQLGAKFNYMGFSLAGSYGNLGDSLRTKTVASDSSNYFWTVGAAYETGPFGASVTYLKSNYDAGTTKDRFSNVSLGADYKLAAGLTPYAELDFVNYNPTGTANDNKATIGIVGTQLAF